MDAVSGPSEDKDPAEQDIKKPTETEVCGPLPALSPPSPSLSLFLTPSVTLPALSLPSPSLSLFLTPSLPLPAFLSSYSVPLSTLTLSLPPPLSVSLSPSTLSLSLLFFLSLSHSLSPSHPPPPPSLSPRFPAVWIRLLWARSPLTFWRVRKQSQRRGRQRRSTKPKQPVSSLRPKVSLKAGFHLTRQHRGLRLAASRAEL